MAASIVRPQLCIATASAPYLHKSIGIVSNETPRFGGTPIY